MESSNKNQIIGQLTIKSIVKQLASDQTQQVMDQIKEILQSFVTDYNVDLQGKDNRIMMEYRDRGKFEAELKVAADLLIFSMHTNIFEFNREHSIWKTPFAKENPLNTYCGIINIYNFLADSFKYSRDEDLGYLIGRIFINREGYFMVEGKRQLGFMYNNMGQEKISAPVLQNIIETAVLYSIEFDLLVPPYDNVKIASVYQMNQKIQSSKIQTGKRLGFTFNADDVSKES